MPDIEHSHNPDPLLVDDAVHEIHQRWGEPHGEDIEPLDQALVRETAEAVLAPLWAEYARLRAATEGDPSSIYHEAAQLRAALRDLIGNAECRCDHPLVTEPCSKCRATAILNAS